MKKIFISSPYIDSEVESACKHVAKDYLKDDVEIIDHRLSYTVLGDDYLDKASEYIKQADLIVFYKNWESAKNCAYDNVYCDMYKLPHIYIH